MKRLLKSGFFSFLLTAAASLAAQPSDNNPLNAPLPAPREVKLGDERLRDSCVWSDPTTQTYYLVSAGRRGPNGRRTVIQYTSKDLETWNGPRVIFEIPADFWTQRGIWAPELHAYKGKFYLFLTFDSDQKFPEQWRNWLPRVKRGSQILVSDSPAGPFQPFANHSTLPEDMMTLDGTFWVEDGVPYMVFCHEWVQIKDGTVEYVKLKDDLSATDGEPVRLFNGSDAVWSKKSDQYGCHVTDGPYLYRLKSGKLAMLWTSGGYTGYTTGIAISDSGKLAGPWRQQAEPVFAADGGHAMLFHRLDGQLMMILHQPNKVPDERAHLFEMEDTGETLCLKTTPEQHVQSIFAELRNLKPMDEGRSYTVTVAGKSETGRLENFLRRRSTEEIAQSGLSTGCGDYAFVFMARAEARGFESRLVEGAEISAVSLKHHFSGHAVVAIRRKEAIDTPWWLVDSTNLKVLSRDWSLSSTSFQAAGGVYWIGYCGTAENYPVHGQDELKEFYARTLAAVPHEFFNENLVRFKFTIDPSLLDERNEFRNSRLTEFLKMQPQLYAGYQIEPAHEVAILLKRGGDDNHADLLYSPAEGWVSHVGLQSGCSVGLLSYFEEVVRRHEGRDRGTFSLNPR